MFEEIADIADWFTTHTPNSSNLLCTWNSTSVAYGKSVLEGFPEFYKPAMIKTEKLSNKLSYISRGGYIKIVSFQTSFWNISDQRIQTPLHFSWKPVARFFLINKSVIGNEGVMFHKISKILFFIRNKGVSKKWLQLKPRRNFRY